jgi:hypothetical protein
MYGNPFFSIEHVPSKHAASTFRIGNAPSTDNNQDHWHTQEIKNWLPGVQKATRQV